MTPPEKFITELDAAQILGLSVHQLRRLRAKGEVPHAKLGTHIVYLESALRRWQADITKQREKPCGTEARSSSCFTRQNRTDRNTGTSTRAAAADELLQEFLNQSQRKQK